LKKPPTKPASPDATALLKKICSSFLVSIVEC